MKTGVKIIAGVLLLVLGVGMYHFWTQALQEFVLCARENVPLSEDELASRWPAFTMALNLWGFDLLSMLNSGSVDAGQLVTQILRRLWIGTYVSFLIAASGFWLVLVHKPQKKWLRRILASLRWCTVVIALFITLLFVWINFQGLTWRFGRIYSTQQVEDIGTNRAESSP